MRASRSDSEVVDDQLRLLGLVERDQPAASGFASGPYLGHMRLRANGRERDVLLGRATRVAPGYTMIHWQNAPLAEVFFSCAPGEDYQIDLGDRLLSGTLLTRHLLGFENGELVEIANDQRVLVRDAAGGWRVGRDDPFPVLAPRDAAARARSVPAGEVRLDPVQRRAVELAPGRTLLVLGEAGAGKTTVALHRMASLVARAGRRPRRAAMIVPSEGLRRFSQAALRRMGVYGAEVWLYDRWAASQARAVFRGLPPRESRDAAAGVIRLKRHPALRETLEVYLRARPGRSAPVSRTDLHELFGDRAHLERVVRAAGGGLTGSMAEEVFEHTRVQFTRTTEEAYAHVDADRLAAVDGRALDDGTPMQDAGTIDTEDYAVLFALDACRARLQGSRPLAPPQYDVLVIDEAQELAPLELELIGRSLAPGGTLVVAGDAGQQVDPGACFAGWDDTMRELGAGTHERIELETSYRCPPEVTGLARRVLEPALPAADGPGGGERTPVLFLSHRSLLHQVTALIEALRRLAARDPDASVAVICRRAVNARRMAALLGRGLGIDLALDGAFDFGPGVCVTCVPEVKGLEFDTVIVPDVEAATWPDEPEARRALYVAVTRTIHQLVLSTKGPASPLLPTTGFNR